MPNTNLAINDIVNTFIKFDQTTIYVKHKWVKFLSIRLHKSIHSVIT